MQRLWRRQKQKRRTHAPTAAGDDTDDSYDDDAGGGRGSCEDDDMIQQQERQDLQGRHKILSKALLAADYIVLVQLKLKPQFEPNLGLLWR